MKLIELSQNGKKYKGMFAKVDDEDYEYLNQFKWYATKRKHCFYAASTMKQIDGVWKNVYMHRFILKILDKKIQIDHKDRDGLNNQRENMRTCNNSENNWNKIAHKDSLSKYIGVSFENKKSRVIGSDIIYKYIVAEISINGKKKRLGVFKTEEAAARAYDAAARIHHGEFANLNFKDNATTNG